MGMTETDVDESWSGVKDAAEEKSDHPKADRFSRNKMTMKKPGMDDGSKQKIRLTCLPAFANEEVNSLSESVLEAENALREVEGAIEEQNERAFIMEEHMKRVQEEILYTQLRADAKRREISTEEHLIKISDMEAARLQREVRNMEKEAEEALARLHTINSSISRSGAKMDHFRLLMQWNQQELQQWAQAAKQKDEDSIALQSYTKSDNTRMKELYLESEKAACALTNLERELDTEVTSTQSAQIQLDRTAQALRENHIERQKLIKLWENAVDAIQKRDDSIHKAAEDFASNKTRIRRKKQELDKLAKVVEKESENTMQLKKRIEIDEEEVIEMRELCREEMSSTKEAEEQLDSLKCKAHRAYADLSGLLVQKEKASEELNLKNTKLEKMEKKLASLRKKVHEESCLLDTLEKKESKLEKMYLLDDKNLKLVQKLVNDLREKHFQTSAKLHASQEKEKDITYEINGAKSQARVLSTQIRQLEMTMIKQEEVLYAAEFQIQCLERKVARASGERSDLETREFNSKILLLEKELEEKKNEEVTISTQLKKSEDHHRSVKRNKEELQKQVTQMEERNAELMLESETGLHALKALVKDKEEKMLARDLLQMEVNRLQEILFLKEDSVHGMECTRERLEKSMEERKDEIESHREKQRLELRALQEDLHFLMMKRKKLALSVEKLQAKYEVVLKRVKVEGEEHSFNYYIIKAAQERQTLQQEGYKLEQEVKQVQEDVSALEVAIQELRYANNLLRHSYKSTQCIELEDEQSILKESLKRAFECLQHKEAKYNSLLQEIAETESRIENAEKERISVAVTLKDLQSKLDTARKEDDEQSLKQKRSKLQLEKLSKDLKDTLGNDAERIQKEIILVELREITKDVLYKLKSIGNENPEVGHLVENRVIEAGFKMPSNTSSVRSSLSGSSRGSISSKESHKPGAIPRKGDKKASARSSSSGSIVTMEFGTEDRRL